MPRKYNSLQSNVIYQATLKFKEKPEQSINNETELRNKKDNTFQNDGEKVTIISFHE